LECLAYFEAILDIWWPFGIFVGHLVYISRFGLLYQEKSGNPDQEAVPWYNRIFLFPERPKMQTWSASPSQFHDSLGRPNCTNMCAAADM
jgi:hypothetical protein